MVEKIYIVRHGFRADWFTTDWKNETGLPRDPPLTDFGLTQAKELGDYFFSLPESERPTAIFSSPYYRCLQTTKPISVALGIPIYVEHGISEWCSPVMPGAELHQRAGSADFLQSFFPEIDRCWSPVLYPSPKGENVAELHERAADFLSRFIPEVERQFPGKHARILLVSHAAPIITLVRGLLDDRKLDLRVGCCSVTEVARRSSCASEWTTRRLGDGSHLRDGAQKEWGFRDL
ncbi:histidine phosphatase superfamily [Infundibulicybe gibba]|nr:histidine phosphatase superfamily [Infundibulicybe gibba]